MKKVYQADEAQRSITAGIWPGRFQFVHKGHEYVLSKILSGFNERIIAIVNPNPNQTADANQPRFNRELNPLNFFQRMLLWKILAEENKMDVSIVPSWHIRRSVLFENEFLPFHCEEYPGRCWIIPMDQSENEFSKASDLQSLGEVICDSDFSNEQEVYRGITASLTRKLYKSNDFIQFNKYTPVKLQSLTRLFMDAPNEEPYKYLIVPIIDDKIDFTSLQFAIKWLKEAEDRYIVVAISVGVEDGPEWWFKSAKRLRSRYPYYKKMVALKRIFKNLDISNYLITPIFVQDNDFGNTFPYCSAFLPLRVNSSWVINKNVKYDYNLLVSLETQNIESIDKSTILVTERNYDFFCIPELKPLPYETDTMLNEEIINLHKRISNFIKLHSTSRDETELNICNRFHKVPEQLMQIIKKVKYNVISEEKAFSLFSSIKKQWDEK